MVKTLPVNGGSRMTSGLVYVCPAVTEHKHCNCGKFMLKRSLNSTNVGPPLSHSQLGYPTLLFNSVARQNYLIKVKLNKSLIFTIRLLQFSTF